MDYIIALLIPVLVAWSRQESALAEIQYGAGSWMLTLFGIGVLAWGLRDLASGLRLGAGSITQEA